MTPDNRIRKRDLSFEDRKRTSVRCSINPTWFFLCGQLVAVRIHGSMTDTPLTARAMSAIKYLDPTLGALLGFQMEYYNSSPVVWNLLLIDPKMDSSGSKNPTCLKATVNKRHMNIASAASSR